MKNDKQKDADMKTIMKIIVLTALTMSSTSYGFWSANADIICGSNPLGCVACDPEVKQANVNLVEAGLRKLMNNELRRSSEFKKIVEVGFAKEPTEKISYYMSLVGITNDAEIVAFIGQREMDPKYVAALAKNANITLEQAVIVAQTLSQALLGKQD